MRHAHTEKSECMYMLVHVVSCLIFPHSHTTIMLLGGTIGLVLPVGIVVCRELPRLTSFNGFIMQRVIPILSPLVFMPSLYSSFHNSKIFLFTSLLPFSMTLCASNVGVARLHDETWIVY